MAKIIKKDVYNLDLLFVAKYSNKEMTIISKNSLKDYYKSIENKLEQLNANDIHIRDDNFYEDFYYETKDNNDVRYCILNRNINIDESIERILCSFDSKQIMAVYDELCLLQIGLINLEYNIAPLCYFNSNKFIKQNIEESINIRVNKK